VDARRPARVSAAAAAAAHRWSEPGPRAARRSREPSRWGSTSPDSNCRRAARVRVHSQPRAPRSRPISGIPDVAGPLTDGHAVYTVARKRYTEITDHRLIDWRGTVSVVEGPVPKHRQLREILLALIDSELPPDTPIPSERDLVDKYNVSRATVREAVGRLVS